MSSIVTPQLPANSLSTKLDELERLAADIRSKQNTGSDVQVPLVASVVTATSHTMIIGAWQDIPGLTTDITVVEASTILVLLSAGLSGNPFLGDSDLSATIAVDGTRQTDEARAWMSGSPPIDDIAALQVYAFSLATGAHTIKAQVQGNVGLGVVLQDSAFAYWIFRQ